MKFNYQSIVNKITDYDRFLSIDELKESSRKLADEYSHVSIEKIGKSRNGEPIDALTVGAGEKTAFLFAMPHPNEPIGSMTIEFLANELAKNEELREAFNFTFVLIKCIDPDGARLNEGWFDGPFTPLNYARNFYRPPGFQQVEWTFPIEYKELNFDAPIPETQALMKIFDNKKPDFAYSLHNAGFGGAYYYISDPCEPLYEKYRRAATNAGIPLHLGEPEMPYAEALSDAVYKMPTTVESYDYIEEYTDRNPAEVLRSGTGSTDYGKRANKDMFSLVCEVPYFYDSRIENHEESDVNRREAILDSVKLSKKMYGYLEDRYDEIEDLLKVDSKFKEAIQENLRTASYLHQSKKSWAEQNNKLDRPATVSQKFDNYVITRFYRMLSFGMFIRMLEQELENTEDNKKIDKLTSIKSQVEEKLEEHNDKLTSSLNYEVIPIKKLVATQLVSGLASIEYLENN
ncbi:peptidase M14 [Candidatus Bipolaricaulota bacterium]|nr:peptidase M14 [Candidatus Bipolaricaulota bacterium]